MQFTYNIVIVHILSLCRKTYYTVRNPVRESSISYSRPLTTWPTGRFNCFWSKLSDLVRKINSFVSDITISLYDIWKLMKLYHKVNAMCNWYCKRNSVLILILKLIQVELLVICYNYMRLHLLFVFDCFLKSRLNVEIRNI